MRDERADILKLRELGCDGNQQGMLAHMMDKGFSKTVETYFLQHSDIVVSLKDLNARRVIAKAYQGLDYDRSVAEMRGLLERDFKHLPVKLMLALCLSAFFRCYDKVNTSIMNDRDVLKMTAIHDMVVKINLQQLQWIGHQFAEIDVPTPPTGRINGWGTCQVAWRAAAGILELAANVNCVERSIDINPQHATSNALNDCTELSVAQMMNAQNDRNSWHVGEGLIAYRYVMERLEQFSELREMATKFVLLRTPDVHCFDAVYQEEQGRILFRKRREEKAAKNMYQDILRMNATPQKP